LLGVTARGGEGKEPERKRESSRIGENPRRQTTSGALLGNGGLVFSKSFGQKNVRWEETRYLTG